MASQTTNRLLVDLGAMPWWVHPEIKISFFRPLTGLTHWFDYEFYPETPFLMHLQNLIWLAAFCVRDHDVVSTTDSPRVGRRLRRAPVCARRCARDAGGLDRQPKLACRRIFRNPCPRMPRAIPKGRLETGSGLRSLYPSVRLAIERGRRCGRSLCSWLRPFF